MNRRLRFWMSGCAAVISLALAGIGDGWADDETDSRAGSWQTSRFDMAQTVQRLQAHAPRHGLTVMARWAPRAAQGSDAQSHLVVVFASAAGGTPVLMAGDGARPDLPLSLRLRTRSDGVVEAWLPTPGSIDRQALPDEVTRSVTELPGLLAEALGAVKPAARPDHA
ncbi:hypothetical protein [Piscinibacter sakaiensis]|uniref:hypothetical protein n=1 Tax=Piscinibacter sakaiensis TaxID=1547922 RepID=UPI003AB0834D